MSTQNPDVYWCTRDESPDGVLSEMVDVWIVAPHREHLEGSAPDVGFIWNGPNDTGKQHRYAQWSLTTTRANCYVVPDTSRECVRVG